MSEWESVSSPRSSAFIGWGTQEGQHVTGTIVHVGTGQKPNNNGPCPELAIELSEPAASFKKDGTRTNYEPGTTVTITAAQYQLERDIQAAQLQPGDMVKITMQGVSQTRNGNTVKDFDVKIKRGAAPVAAAPAAQPAQSSFGGGTDLRAEAPF